MGQTLQCGYRFQATTVCVARGMIKNSNSKNNIHGLNGLAVLYENIVHVTYNNTRIVQYECITSQIIQYIYIISIEYHFIYKYYLKSRQFTILHQNIIFYLVLYITFLEHNSINKNNLKR